jgi:kynurenine 3-monooxygenase
LALDIRTLEHVPGKSINLAMSVRGLSALDKIGLGDHVAREYGIPMRARRIHNLDGTTYPVPYGTKEQCIYSVGRRYVNEILLTGKRLKEVLFVPIRFLSKYLAGERWPNLHYHFDHKMTKIDLKTAEVSFQRYQLLTFTPFNVR